MTGRSAGKGRCRDESTGPEEPLGHLFFSYEFPGAKEELR
jgi:hypothetical protein